MKTLKIDTTDVILMDLAPNSGKIIISDSSCNYTFSYQWNAMSGNLWEFLSRINEEYFVKNLSPARHGRFNSKKTMQEVRKWLRNDCELMWYQHMEFQKCLREELKSIENSVDSVEEFCSYMGRLPDTLPYWRFDKKWETEKVKEQLSYLSDEPWSFVIEDEPYENIWLAKLFQKLRQAIQPEKISA